MFELTAGTIDRPFREQHAAASIVSVTSHVVTLGITGALLFTISDKLPGVSTLTAFVAEGPAPGSPAATTSIASGSSEERAAASNAGSGSRTDVHRAY